MILLSKIWSFITSKAAGWIGIIGAAIAALAMVRKSGADSVRAKDMKQTLEGIIDKNEIHEKVVNMSDAELDSELRK